MQPLRRLLKSRRASVVATQKRNNPAASWFARGAKWSATIDEIPAPNIIVWTATAAVSVWSATKRLPAERNTRILPRWESNTLCRRICTVHSWTRPDHRFLAHDRPHSCVCYSCVWMVLCPALIASNEHFSGKNGTLRWSILVGKQKHNVQSPTGILILLTSGIWNPRSSPSKESKSGIQAPLIDKKFEIQYREIGIHSLKSRIQGSLWLPYKYCAWGDFFDIFPWPLDLL